MKTCEEFEGLLDQWADDEISASDRARLEAHVAGCAECRKMMSHLEEITGDCVRLAACAEQIAAGVQARRTSIWYRGEWKAAAAILIVVTLTWSLRPGREHARPAQERTTIVQANVPRDVIRVADAGDIVLNHPSHELAVEFESKQPDVRIVWLYTPVPETVNAPTSAPKS
jgi:hypothetical protein